MNNVLHWINSGVHHVWDACCSSRSIDWRKHDETDGGHCNKDPEGPWSCDVADSRLSRKFQSMAPAAAAACSPSPHSCWIISSCSS